MCPQSRPRKRDGQQAVVEERSTANRKRLERFARQNGSVVFQTQVSARHTCVFIIVFIGKSVNFVRNFPHDPSPAVHPFRFNHQIVLLLITACHNSLREKISSDIDLTDFNHAQRVYLGNVLNNLIVICTGALGENRFFKF